MAATIMAAQVGAIVGRECGGGSRGWTAEFNNGTGSEEATGDTQPPAPAHGRNGAGECHTVSHTHKHAHISYMHKDSHKRTGKVGVIMNETQHGGQPPLMAPPVPPAV